MNARMAVLLCCMLPLVAARAQDLPMRDPTQEPPEFAATGASAQQLSADAPLGAEGMTVMVRDGKPFVAVGTRLYGVGQSLGRWRVARISETEVWLRDGKTVQKFQRFSSIQRTSKPWTAICVNGVAVDSFHSTQKATAKKGTVVKKKAKNNAEPVVCDSIQP